LSNRTKLSTDAANGKNLKELTNQWDQRKHRLYDYFNNEEVVVQNNNENEIVYIPMDSTMNEDLLVPVMTEEEVGFAI
jgi:hypothetical protein